MNDRPYFRVTPFQSPLPDTTFVKNHIILIPPSIWLLRAVFLQVQFQNKIQQNELVLLLKSCFSDPTMILILEEWGPKISILNRHAWYFWVKIKCKKSQTKQSPTEEAHFKWQTFIMYLVLELSCPRKVHGFPGSKCSYKRWYVSISTNE